MAESINPILIVLAHPRPRQSTVVMRMAAQAAKIEGVKVHDIYAAYPDFLVNIQAEQELLRQHEVVIFLHPFNWYSAPALLREWQDVVLEYGFAYGRHGKELRDKVFFNAISAGRSIAEYSGEHETHFTLRQLAAPFEQMARLCGMIYLPPFALTSARTAAEENRLEPHLKTWRALLQALADGTLDIGRAADSPYLGAETLAPAAETSNDSPAKDQPQAKGAHG
ncbi:MAG: NAD(P)H-dependent oxidoreductase [Paracoccaceae bacterium]